jgi:hypothetical protein
MANEDISTELSRRRTGMSFQRTRPRDLGLGTFLGYFLGRDLREAGELEEMHAA